MLALVLTLLAAADLPDVVHLRTTKATYNRKWYAVVKDKGIFLKPNKEVTRQGGPWVPLRLPDGLKGDVQEISIDDTRLVATNSKRQLFSLTEMLSGADKINKPRKWTTRWGAPFGMASGWRLPEGYLAWSLSMASPEEDEYYMDLAGNRQMIGKGACTTIFALNRNGQHISVLDPWLPLDYSYEVDGPRRGRFVSTNVAASGSVIFVINKHGDMYTRLWDFDISGSDRAFFRYTYEDQRGVSIPKKLPIIQGWSTYPAIQLPIRPWNAQPKIKGRITDDISIAKRGKGCVHRTLRVAGQDEQGRTGYYEKDLGDAAWVFKPTGEPLRRPLIDNTPHDATEQTLGPAEERRFRYAGDFQAELLDFHLYSPPATLRVQLAGGPVDLLVHYTDGLRQFEKHGRGLERSDRKLHAVIEVPQALFDKHKGAPGTPFGKFLKKNLSTRNRFVRIHLAASAREIALIKHRIIGPTWKFKAVR